MQSYQITVAQLKRELLACLGSRIDSVVLYGSAARGQYRPGESDIDILIIGEAEDRGLKAEISEIVGNIDLKHSTATSVVYLSNDRCLQYLDWVRLSSSEL